MEKEVFISSFLSCIPWSLSCSGKRKSPLYWTQFHNSLLLLMKTHSWWVLFCTSIYACAQGMGRFPLTKWNTVLASRQTLWIIAISISQQRTWDCEFVCSFEFFLCQLCEGEQWAMLLLNHNLCCSDWKSGWFSDQDKSPSLTPAAGAWFHRHRWTLPASPLYLRFTGGMGLVLVLDSSYSVMLPGVNLILAVLMDLFSVD